MTLPSFLAASMSCGVIAVAGGAAAKTLAEGTRAPAAIADEPFRTSRLDHVGVFIAGLLCFPSILRHQPLSTRQRSGGRWSQTDSPCGIFSAAEATTRIWVPA